jgi:8-oxo-dGTP pyrophosphatase MutT (NUDIX family)
MQSAEESFFSRLKVTGGITGRDKYFTSVVLAAFAEINSELCLILEKRSQNIRQAGEISFPGGQFDEGKDKSPADTAVRETIEELGIDIKKIHLKDFFGTSITPAGLLVDVYTGYLDIKSIDELDINTYEVEKVLAVPLSFFARTRPESYSINVQMSPWETDQLGNRNLIFPAEKLGLPERYHNDWKFRNHRIYVYRCSGEIIWGLTAEIIYEIIRIMEK